MSLTRALIAYHREYLRALRQPPDTRMRGLMSYCLLAEKRDRQRHAAAELAETQTIMQANYLRQIIVAGQADIEQIKSDFIKPGADQAALLAKATQIHAATEQALLTLKTIEESLRN